MLPDLRVASHDNGKTGGFLPLGDRRIYPMLNFEPIKQDDVEVPE